MPLRSTISPRFGHDGHNGSAIAFGLRPQVIMAHHLQKHQARDQQQKTAPTLLTAKDADAKPRQIGFNVAQARSCRRSAGPPQARSAPRGGSALHEVSKRGGSSYKGRLASGSGARRWGANKTMLATGHKRPPPPGTASNIQNPGNCAPCQHAHHQRDGMRRKKKREHLCCLQGHREP
jgi:hypothetical protein